MANTVVISRAHLIYGICLPLAVLLGYLLASPFESGSIAVVVLVFSVLSVPLLMRWHHPLLILSINSFFAPVALPGHPTLWMLATIISFSFLILDRAMGQNVQFFRARSVAYSLIFLALVVWVTAKASGGIGFSSMGATNAGGRRYITIWLGVLAYFALSSITIKPKHRMLAVAVFFLSSATVLVPYLVTLAGPGFYFLDAFFPIEDVLSEMSAAGTEVIGSGIVRAGELGIFGVAVFCLLMARTGARGVFDFTKPWRLGLLLLCLIGSLYSGYRSSVLLIMLTFFVMFYLEGLFRTRYFPALVLTVVLAGAITVPYVRKLPFGVQRALCFLPINVDPVVRLNAEGSTDWRVLMWKEVLPTVPNYLIRGKGLMMNTDDSFMIEQARARGQLMGYEGALLAGDYHSGPLSLIVPFGLFGVAGFFWFLTASVKVLRQNYYFGEPELRNVNRFMLGYFVARVVFYLLIFGSFYSDLIIFTSVVGLSISLNGGVCQPAHGTTTQHPALEEETEP